MWLIELVFCERCHEDNVHVAGALLGLFALVVLVIKQLSLLVKDFFRFLI